jgi:hypothetical protein
VAAATNLQLASVQSSADGVVTLSNGVSFKNPRITPAKASLWLGMQECEDGEGGIAPSDFFHRDIDRLWSSSGSVSVSPDYGERPAFVQIRIAGHSVQIPCPPRHLTGSQWLQQINRPTDPQHAMFFEPIRRLLANEDIDGMLTKLSFRGELV